MVRPNPHIPITDPPMRKNEMNTKLTEYQNEKITETLCEMTINGYMPDDIKAARRSLVTECEEVNLATKKHALWREGPLTATEAAFLAKEAAD